MRVPSTYLKVLERQAVRFYSKPVPSSEQPLYLNPHEWKGLAADQIFELHNVRKEYLGDRYNPSDEERNAILSTITALSKNKPELDYAYEIDGFKERYMNNTPMNKRGLPQKRSNTYVIERGATPHETRRIEQLTRIAAYEMPLLAKFRQPYKPKSSQESPLRLTYNTDFSDETSSKFNRLVTLNCNIKDLKLSEKEEHKFILLAGNKYNFDTTTFRLKSDQYAEAAQNARWLVDTFNKLLAEAKDLTKDDFADIPLDSRHMKLLHKKPKPTFPEAWKRPQDAPVVRHKVVNRLVELVKEKKDSEYVSGLSP
ncbi:mitochondrial ribosome small subunit component [Scheffersomyces xylosifermentans]|uniref:mitochondrial ribosome small subunit component n=1 Tax=Scheffersomyces xylosifermentans TaxID=1304137 RepID=UPI00315C994B